MHSINANQQRNETIRSNNNNKKRFFIVMYIYNLDINIYLIKIAITLEILRYYAKICYVIIRIYTQTNNRVVINLNETNANLKKMRKNTTSTTKSA